MVKRDNELAKCEKDVTKIFNEAQEAASKPDDHTWHTYLDKHRKGTLTKGRSGRKLKKFKPQDIFSASFERRRKQA